MLICQNILLLKYGGAADILVKIKDLESLKYVLKVAKENEIPLFILGNGSNILVKDSGIRGIVCKIEIEKLEIKEEGKDVYVTLRGWL